MQTDSTTRWRHERTNLDELKADEDGVRRGVVDKWWYGSKSYPREGDPVVYIEAFTSTDQSGWMYMVQDEWNLVDMEQEFTRTDATANARNRVDLYRDRGYRDGEE